MCRTIQNHAFCFLSVLMSVIFIRYKVCHRCLSVWNDWGHCCLFPHALPLRPLWRFDQERHISNLLQQSKSCCVTVRYLAVSNSVLSLCIWGKAGKAPRWNLIQTLICYLIGGTNWGCAMFFAVMVLLIIRRPWNKHLIPWRGLKMDLLSVVHLAEIFNISEYF